MKTEKKNMNNFSDFCNKGEIKLGKTGMMEKKNVKNAVIKLTMNGKPQQSHSIFQERSVWH